ncbi:enoyl-CoA hydratase/isomerase family protein [Kitasatospora cineracea]|uniref:Enoyl-CoA hydratase/carnithine racemase n=1 Tax=Kitasatospora cineracea TaxID=88074 RepID=A0A8G1UM35_9ACTN|nr:enoyl-CoA hydratase/isomerase family protein [Kitasatospora cineracea]ROR46556.1 enoyl-CoA hydratase/carnithine racemase [Kitasatospora cineracea]
MSSTAAVDVHRADGIATVRIGQRQHANALGIRDWRVLASVFDDLATDLSVRAVIVAGHGDRTFSAGSDLREWLGADPEVVEASFVAMENALTALERIPVPTLARIRGDAVGAGCQLACACDLRVITEDARIGMPVARWGILLPPMFAARLAVVAGPAVAMDLVLTGRLLDGTQAARLGLATRAVPEDDLEDATAALVAAVTAQPLGALRAAKQAVRNTVEPVRTHMRDRASGPAADFAVMQHNLGVFLRRLPGRASRL